MRDPALDRRWVDVSYAHLVADPMAVVADICGRFGWPLESAAVNDMEAWLMRQAEQRRGEPPHRYRPEDYGLTPEAVDEASAPYRDFVAARGIRLSDGA